MANDTDVVVGRSHVEGRADAIHLSRSRGRPDLISIHG